MAENLVISIIDKLKDPVLNELYFLRSVGGKVDSVREKLEWIKSFLRDAESRSNEEEVFKLWVEKIREVAYRIEDAIDVYVVEIKGDRFMGSRLTACVKWIIHKSRIMKPAALHRLGVELDDIEQTLKEIKENRETFKVDDPVDGARGKAKLPVGLQVLPKYHHGDRIVGLETDREAIVSKLLDTQNPLKVISIVGTGGLGKTTLAREVFNSAEVKGKFDILIWLTVSQEFKTSSILKKMLGKIRKIEEEEKDRDAEYFVDEISKSLKKKRFLIVLDDVWSETFWPDIIRAACPPHNAINCGRVVITTRDLKVAQKAQSEPYELKFLNIEESKLLLYKVSFPEQEPPKGIDPVATEIAKKCGGLPLAIVVVGGGLHMEHTSSQWRKVAERMDWSDCMKILWTSYDDMPSVLKTCFMYLASFPEDELIDAPSLVRMWVADDVVPDEETGDERLQQLAQRCLIIVRATSYDGSVAEFRVHDLLLKLAIDKAKESKLLSVFTKQNPDQIKISISNARRASLQSCTFSQSSSNFQNDKKAMRNYNRKLRFLMAFGSLPDCSEFRLLKVLKVHSCDISFSQLEKVCEQLIHMRHLELRACDIDTNEIPKTIGHLKNLQTLDCSGTLIHTLPDSLWTITTLRHVIFHSFSGDLPRAPLPSASLSNLKILGSIAFESVTKTNWYFQPNCFPNLHELTIIYNNRWIATMLEELNQLVTLKIYWHWESPPDVFDMSALPFYQKLQYLHLRGIYAFAGRPYYLDFPKSFWPPNLTKLVLFNLGLLKDPMPDLGKLRNLEILDLGFFNFEQKEIGWIFSDGSFPQLQQLMLHDIHSEVNEFSIALGAIPELKKFHMKGFGMLNNIPELQHLRMLQEFEWTNARFTEEQIQAIQQENQHNIHHIRSFRIESSRRR